MKRSILSIETPTYFAIGVPAGITFPNDRKTLPFGSLVYQQQVKTLDLIHYAVWGDAVTGEIDRGHMKRDASYWSPGAEKILFSAGERIPNMSLRDVIGDLQHEGVLWSWDEHLNPLTWWTQLVLHPLGQPLGDNGQRGLYHIGRNIDQPALGLDEVSYMLWLEWYDTPQLDQSVRIIARDIQQPVEDVLGRAVATMANAMRANLLYVDAVQG